MNQLRKPKMKLGLMLQTNSNWMGGVYYVLNLAKAISLLPDDERPELFLFHSGPISDELMTSIGGTKGQLVDLSQLSILERIRIKLSGLLGKSSALHLRCQSLGIDLLLPLIQREPSLRISGTRIAHWIPDFQHKFLSHLFDQKEIEQRDRTQASIAADSELLILSSYDAQSHFKQFYPQSKIDLMILRFQSMIRATDVMSDDEAAAHIPKRPYFMVSNQFWTHKNHLLVLEALKLLKDRGLNPLVLFTGKFHDPRDPEYSLKFQDYVTTHALDEHVKLLGFIDRNLQLKLMKESAAVIQPSQFEGWSTVIEDAKALGCKVLASDLAVNMEQLEESGQFFAPEDAQGLAELMAHAMSEPAQKRAQQSDEDRLKYARSLNSLLTAHI